MKDSKSQNGRPPLFTIERAEKVIEAVRRGLTLKLAAAYAGISYDTLNRWRKKGCEEPETEFSKFCEALEQALAEAALHLVDCINEAAKKDWKAATWLLSRRYPKQYGENGNEEGSSLCLYKVEEASFLGSL